MAPPVPPRPLDPEGSGVAGGVVVTGATSAIGRRICRLLAADPEVARVVAVDRSASDQAGVEGHALDRVDLKRACEGAAALIHLGSSGGYDVDGTGVSPDPGLTRDLLEAAAAASVPRVVLLSSATVYGAWPNNPVPLTEEAPLRPNAELASAVARAEDERLVGEWAAAHPAASVVALRTALTASEQTQGWMSRSPWPRAGLHAGDREPPVQFLHLDDLASALEWARTSEVDGVLNVAPDGWISPDTFRALVAPSPLVRLPEPVASRVATVRYRTGLSDAPPAVLPYTMHPWVVANDRLRAEGWEPTHTNEEAFVVGHRAGPLATMSPRRRQEVSLFATGAMVAGAVAAVTILLRRRR